MIFGDITRILHLDNIVNSKNFHFGISFLYYIGQTIILVCTKDKKNLFLKLETPCGILMVVFTSIPKALVVLTTIESLQSFLNLR